MNDTLYVLLAGGLCLLFFVLVLPKLSLVFPRMIKLGFVPEAESRQRFDSLNPETHQLVEQIESLGFERMGIRFEKGLLGLNRVFSVCFSSYQERAFASIVLSHGLPESFYLLSTFKNGAVVFTSSRPGLRQDVASDDCRYGGVLKGSPAELLDVHRRRVQEFERHGHALVLEFSHEGRDASTRAYYRNPTIHQRMRTIGFMAVLQTLLLIAVVAFAGVRFIQRLEKKQAPETTSQAVEKNDSRGPDGAGP